MQISLKAARVNADLTILQAAKEDRHWQGHSD